MMNYVMTLPVAEARAFIQRLDGYYNAPKVVHCKKEDGAIDGGSDAIETLAQARRAGN
jgi:hypothetical protein